jgi:hypothetical protein
METTMRTEAVLGIETAGARDHAIWVDVQERVRAEMRRLDDVMDELRESTRDMIWQGPGAGRFRWRTQRRLRELRDQRELLTLLLSSVRRAAIAVHAPRPS